jgi:hypothetical protein
MEWFKKRVDRPATVKIAAHSIAEEHLFIEIMHCQACGGGPVERNMHCFPCTWILKCSSCGQAHELVSEQSLIMTEEYLRVLKTHNPTKINRYQRCYNHTDEPSNIIELTAWLNLIAMCLASMDELAEREEQESQQYVSAEFHLVQCLQEALKFYTGDEEFPPRDAFFSEQTYAAYEADRSAFSQDVLRSVLLQQRPLSDIEDDLDRFDKEAREHA